MRQLDYLGVCVQNKESIKWVWYIESGMPPVIVANTVFMACKNYGQLFNRSIIGVNKFAMLLISFPSLLGSSL
jgi:hypothetical protein